LAKWTMRLRAWSTTSQARAWSVPPVTGVPSGSVRSRWICSAATRRSTAASRPIVTSARLSSPIWKSTGAPRSEKSDIALFGDVRNLNAASATQRHQPDASARKFRSDRKGLTLSAARESFDPIKTASRDEIAALQLERLKWTLSHAYNNVGHYKKAFDKASVHPRDLKTLDDLPRFPFTAKEDLRAHYPFGMFAIPRDHVLRVHASSGTTGKPTVVGYSQRDLDTWAGLMARSMRAAGCKPGMLVQNSYGYGLFTGGIGFHYGAERLGMTVVPVSGGMTVRQVHLIADFRPDVIF